MSDQAGASECRLMIDRPAPGAWNMAVDEMLLEWSAQGGGCCWRFYGWSEPTLSLGYFQRYEDRWGHVPSRKCVAVRRLSGGGAILHDEELTYSFVVPSRHRLAVARRGLYELIHGALIAALCDLAISAALCEGARWKGRASEPFLCFQRRAPGDVLVDGVKIAGSAQRRRRGAVLQHGSVLLKHSHAAPEVAALEDVTGRAIQREQLLDAWLPRVVDRLGVRWYDDPRSDQQRLRSGSLVEIRYGQAGWTETSGRKGSGADGGK